MSDLVTDSLMACAEQAGDITDTVYQHFFDACTSAGQLMDHDEGMRPHAAADPGAADG